MTALSRGDKCFVRRYNGEIVEATYDIPRIVAKEHWVYINVGKKLVNAHAGNNLSKKTNDLFEKVRFVNMNHKKVKQ